MILMLRPLLRYAQFTGRASRAEFWLFRLLQVIVYGAFLALIVLAMTGGAGAGMAWIYGGLIVAFALACVVPNLAVMVRRLHDSGKSAWWLLLYAPGLIAAIIDVSGFVSALHGGIGAMVQQLMIAAPLVSIGGLCNFVLYILMGLKGTTGPNRFGDDPKQVRSSAGAFDDMGQTDDIDRRIARYQSRQEALQSSPGLANAQPLPLPSETAVQSFGKRRA